MPSMPLLEFLDRPSDQGRIVGIYGQFRLAGGATGLCQQTALDDFDGHHSTAFRNIPFSMFSMSSSFSSSQRIC